MSKLIHSFAFQITPCSPYDFRLTVKKPAGWSLFTPFEEFEADTLWTAVEFSGNLLGIKLASLGTVNKPLLRADLYSKEKVMDSDQARLKCLIEWATGCSQDLSEFYKFASSDSILRNVIDNLFGMHDTSPLTVFSEAVLAILLQMAPLKRSTDMMNSFITEYGRVAEFDGRRIRVWPSPEAIAQLQAVELAERCRVGYRAKNIVNLARKLSEERFPLMNELSKMDQNEARALLLKLPGIGDYSADIISPHGGFPIDVWSAEVFGMLFFGKKPENNRLAVDAVKKEGLRRWGKWSWMAFFYIVQDLKGLSEKLGIDLRLS